MVTEQRKSGGSELVRTVIGTVLFVLWLVLTTLWVGSIVAALGQGEPAPLIMGVCALLLMVLLAGMEGLEVAVIDRAKRLFPSGSGSDLAGWLAARQLFVALIVTTATILVEPHRVPLPGGGEIPGGGWLKAFTIVWTTMTVLWFMQILPKHMAATNPDRYLRALQPSLFPIVQFVYYLGFDKPAATTATFIERRLDWRAGDGDEPDASGQFESIPTSSGPNLAEAWAGLVPADESRDRRRAADA